MIDLSYSPTALAVRQILPLAVPLIASVDAGGWSAQAGAALALPAMTSDGTSEFGADGASAKTVTLARQGFDAGGNAVTVSEALTITKRVRQAYPNHALATAATVSLSDYVYATDSIAGVANNSGEVSPKPVANWIMPHRLVVGNAIEWEISAWHRNARAGQEVACVRVRASDGTNTTAWQTVSATGVSGRAGDRYPVVCHRGSLDISGLADIALITLEAWVYPWIGAAGAVLKSGDSSEGRGFSPRYFLRNTGLAANPPFAYVATGGNDGTGVVSTNAASAAAAPFLTVLGAINGIHAALSATTGVDGAVIRIGHDGGTPFVLGSSAATRTQRAGCLTITRDPAVPRGSARVSFGATAFRPRLGGALTAPLASGALRLAEIAIVRTGALTFQGEAAAPLELIFDDVDFDNGAQTVTILNNSHLSAYGMTASNAATNWLGAGTYELRCLRGVQANLGTNTVEAFLLVGSRLTGVGGTSIGGRSENGSIRAFFSATLTDSTKAGLTYGSTADVSGAVLAQCVLEYIPAATASAARMSGDGAAGNTSHIVHHHVTHAGANIAGRNNDFYDETTGAARTHRLMSCVGLLLVQQNTKHDVFKADGGRTGGWSFLYGVGCRGVYTQYGDAQGGGLGAGFAQAWPGLGCRIGTSNSVPQQAVASLFAANAATTFNGTSYVAGAGGGDYTLVGGALAKAMVAGVLSHDLAGAARNATTSAGAYQ